MSESEKVFDLLAASNLDQAIQVGDVVDENGWSAAHHAAEQGDVEVLKTLHQLKFSLNWVNDDNVRPLEVAIGCEEFDAADFLLSAGIGLEPTPEGLNSLDIPSMNNCPAQIEFCLSRGASVDGLLGSRPPLVWAVQEDSFEVISILLRDGANLFRSADPELDNMSALSMAASEGKEECLRQLLFHQSSEANFDPVVVLEAMELARAFDQSSSIKLIQKRFKNHIPISE